MSPTRTIPGGPDEVILSREQLEDREAIGRPKNPSILEMYGRPVERTGDVLINQGSAPIVPRIPIPSTNEQERDIRTFLGTGQRGRRGYRVQ